MNENNINIEFPIIDMRPYQEDIWDRFINNDIYLTILIWHRRGGKDIFSFNSLVEKALERNGGNRKKAAAELGISDRTL